MFTLCAVVTIMTLTGVETPAYTVIEQREEYEVREYPAQIRAEVTMTGPYRESMNNGFRKLADFIFGNNASPDNHGASGKIAMTAPVLEQEQKSAKIAMTAPVLEREKEQDQRVVSFVMPSHYTLETLPKPKNPEVRIVQVPAKRYAVIRFSGWVQEEKSDKMKNQLVEMLKRDGLATAGEPLVAQYNPPWTLPFLRRNEIWVELVPSPSISGTTTDSK